MKKIALILTCIAAAAHISNAQTLFKYGKHEVSKQEFLTAYSKNPDSSGNRQEKLEEYLNLYINFKLKLQAAYDENINTNAELQAETENFKSQLTDNFINKQANLAGLVHEAFLRSHKDILLQQVFVQFDGTDTIAAYKQISKALDELKAGKNFEEISVQYSNVKAVKDVRGTVGYITVFTLPYSIENIIYDLKPGGFSAIYKSGAGYHIFKNAGERPAVGRRKIQQLLLATPDFYSDEQLNEVKQQADSIYKLLQNGASFAAFMPLYGHNFDSNDPYNTIEIKTGDYTSDFEKAVFGLKEPGDVSKPFKTAYGYNIIKLVEKLPVPSTEDDLTFETYLQTQVQNTGRLDAAKTDLVKKWLGVTGFKETNYNKKDLWIYTDSTLRNTGKIFASYKAIKPETVLFQFTGRKFTVTDWIGFLESKDILPGTGAAGYSKLMNDFIQASCTEYYRAHIEEFDPSISEQVKEFNEANMLFYIMDKHVWSKASNDTAGLKKYYEQHKSNYTWQKSVTALVVSVPGKVMADSIALKIKNNPSKWRSIVASYKEVYADSGRFDVNELPVKVKPEANFQTLPESNEGGNVYTFVHVLSFNDKPEQKSFEEARGIVINDYQEEIEKDWIKSLKTTYPVSINGPVLKALH